MLVGFHEAQPLWKEVCSDLLSHYKADGESFFSWIVTVDETRILNRRQKRQSIEQYHPASWKKFKVTPSAGKVTVTVHRFFWGEEGGMPGDFGRHHAM